jgi:subtilase family serine protease
VNASHSPARNLLSALGVAATVALVVTGTVATATAAPDRAQPTGARHLLNGTRPVWAVPAHRVVTPKPSTEVTIDVQLALRDATTAQALADSVSDPHSARYGDFLSSAAFDARFAPTEHTVREIEAFLRTNGLRTDGVPPNHRYVEATGSVADIQRAFATTLADFRIDGAVQLAPATTLSVPARLGAAVLTVTGLGDDLATSGARRQAPQVTQPSGALPPATACSGYWNEYEQSVPRAYGRTRFPTYACGYTPQQVQGAYRLNHLMAIGHRGAGAKVAIIGTYASPTLTADTAHLFADVDAPAFGSGQLTQQVFRPFTKVGPCGGRFPWRQEETLDVEAVHAVAPAADQLYVGASNCGGGLDDALNWVIAHVDDPSSAADGVTLVNNSWEGTGESESAGHMASETAIFVQAALEGVGVYFASGDYGDNAGAGLTPTPQPDQPGSNPFVTDVGGSTLAVDSHDGYDFETGWGSAYDVVKRAGHHVVGYKKALPGTFEFGSTGGTSTVFPEPYYQLGVVPNALARAFDGTPNRVAPDLAMDGDPYTGLLAGLTDSGQYAEYPIGGTSLASPLFVGLQADIQGRRTAIGFADPLLYDLQRDAFHDIVPAHPTVAMASTRGSALFTADRDTSLRARVGYDDVTGRGTPDGPLFAAAEWSALDRR